MLAVKRKSPRLKEGYNTWCGLLCAYRTTSLAEIKDLKAKIDAFLAKIHPEGVNLA
jgi:hypothetical protein